MFVTLGIVLVLAIALGLLLGGRAQHLAELRFAAMPALAAGLVLGLLPRFVQMPAAANRGLVAAANVIVIVFLALNIARHAGPVRAGLALLAAGWLLNALVITANGAMPLSRWAFEESGQYEAIDAGKGGFFKIEQAGDDTRLRFLGDVIPLRPIRQVLSIGDFALIAGIGVVVAGGMRPKAGVA